VAAAALAGRAATDWIEHAPSTNLNAVAATAMAIATGAVFLVGVLIEKHPDPVTFGIWCGFLAGWKGINVRQFGVKRATDFRLEAARAGVPPIPEGG
jgi:hypothetical protein